VALIRMHKAAQRNDVAKLTSIVEVNERDKKQRTPLHWACDGCAEEAVQLLLKRGARTDVADVAGDTPLILAAKSGSLDIVNTLLKSGDAVDSTLLMCDTNGYTALHWAVRMDNAEIVSAILSVEKTKRRLLLSQGVVDGFTALHLACI
jgi:ankyrin repeat protein